MVDIEKYSITGGVYSKSERRDIMNNLSKRNQEILKDNYRAYIHNFEKPVIIPDEFEEGFYVYKNKEDYTNERGYVQYCYNIDYLNGWLYGAVQAKCKII